MLINGTLIVQAFNFLIIYLLLRMLLFKPAVAIIQTERRTVKKLEGLVQQETDAINRAEDARTVAWQKAQKQFLREVPRIELQGRAPLVMTIPVIADGSMPQAVQELATDQAHFLVKRLRNVH